MLTVVVGALAFTVIVLALVATLLAAKARLAPSGSARLSINDDPTRELKAPVGETLLSTLAAREVFLPSACGGKGTCGVCKVVVADGGGRLLPTERSLVSRGEERRGVRLSCQIKVREDMRIELPEAVLGTRRWQCKVRSNESVATFIKELVLELPEGESVPYHAGGYIQVQVPPHRMSYRDIVVGEQFQATWSQQDLWSLTSEVAESETVYRAYSIASAPTETGVVMLDVRIAVPPAGAPGAPPGKASSWLFGLEPGDDVEISGPYGDFFVKETKAEMVFVGGGAGMAPLRSMIFDQIHRVQTARKLSFWYGARSLREAFYVSDFERLAREHPNFSFHLALSEPLPEDDWTGATGFIHQVVFDDYLATHPAPEDVEFYLCGPPQMIQACRAMLTDIGVEAENIAYDEF